MMAFFRDFHRKRVEDLQQKEVLIDRSKNTLTEKIQDDVERINKINKVLGNGITLSIGKAVGAHHR